MSDKCDVEEFKQHCNAQGAIMYNEVVNGEMNVLEVGNALFNIYMLALANAASLPKEDLDFIALAVEKAKEATNG